MRKINVFITIAFTIAAVLSWLALIPLWGNWKGLYLGAFELKVLPLLLSAISCVGWVLVTIGESRKDTETRCRECGHILKGISEPRCPECGHRI